MVANLSSHKKGWDERWAFFSDWAEKGQALVSELLFLVDEDTASFNRIMDAFSLPKSNEEEKAARSAAIQEATLYATRIPLRTMSAACKCFDIVDAMVREGNPNSVTDAGVGALAALAAVKGAYLNVRINAAGLKDKTVAASLTESAEELLKEAVDKEMNIWKQINEKIA